MKLNLTDMLYVMSYTLDAVEAELLGLETGHCRRVAYLSLIMAKKAGMKDDELRDFVGCCLMHDNALTEFINEELVYDNYRSVPLSEVAKKNEVLMNLHHSILGERNMRLLPFKTDVKNIIQHHHENADGSGALKRTVAQTSLKSQILHLADKIDISKPLMTMQSIEFDNLLHWVKGNEGSLFSTEAVELFTSAVTYDDIVYLQTGDVRAFFKKELGSELREYSYEEIHNIADFFAEIADFKSEFTNNHSQAVAAKAELMARYYGYDSEKTARLYFAAALHDIGQMIVTNDNEQPTTINTFKTAKSKNHASETHRILNQIDGIEDIVSWASNHHEKLNGSGYPQGLKASQLSFEDRLIACIDIYQDLVEEKQPYKDGMTHSKAIAEMLDMAKNGEIDEKIVRDMDIVMSRA